MTEESSIDGWTRSQGVEIERKNATTTEQSSSWNNIGKNAQWIGGGTRLGTHGIFGSD